MKRFMIVLVVIIVLAGALYAYKLYTGKVPSLTEVKADASVSATDLIAAFEKDSASANKHFLGKILEVSGNIKSVEKESATVSLGNAEGNSSVRCSIDSAFVKDIATLNPGSLITIKGNCTGYMPDETGMGLGSDVVLNRCVLEKKK
jgi:hypothetical protein